MRSEDTLSFHHCIAGMFIGGMQPLPTLTEVEAVLTLAAVPGAVGDGIKHRHLPMSYIQPIVREDLYQGLDWIEGQLAQDRRVLIRSEGGRNRPGLLVAGMCVKWGGATFDAIRAARHGHVSALTDFRYANLELRALWHHYNDKPLPKRADYVAVK